MLATIPSATLLGARGRPVIVEVHVSQGLPMFSVVGLPDEACRESRDRVRAALLSSGLTWPQKRITVNLAPSSVRKGGAGLDLPIAIGVLVASAQLAPAAVADHAFLGELGLDGSVRRMAGVVPLAAALGDAVAVVPADCVHEATLVATRAARGVTCLAELVAALRGATPWPQVDEREPPPPTGPEPPDLCEVRGHPLARFALEVAAAGGHHLLMLGPPGSGKTMLAQRLPGLLPPLPAAVALEATMIHSAAGLALPDGGLVSQPPLRAPHHTASIVAMVGGGTTAMRPGEVSLSHGGVLFLDELAEFPGAVLDGLREPLEEGVVRVTRAKATVDFPARFLLVAAMNPCPCGEGVADRCRCPEPIRARYLRRVSGPLLDRFDLRVLVHRPSVDELIGGDFGESTDAVAARVVEARAVAAARGFPVNARIPGHRLDDLVPLTPAARGLLRRELERDRLTGRGLHRVRRVARTVADLQGGGEVVGEESVIGALQLRIDPHEQARAAA